MTIRTKKAGQLKEGDVIALPFGKTATVQTLTVQTKYRVIVRWEEDYPPTTFGVDQEVLIDVPDAPEKLYLVCRGCGEACDSIETANEHFVWLGNGPDTGVCADEGYDILPESEAM